MTPDTNERKRKRVRAKGTGSIFKPKGSRFYWIAYVSGGKRHYESTKSQLKCEAQTMLTDKLGDIGKGIEVTPKVGKLTLGDALKSVVNKMEQDGRKSVEKVQGQIDTHLLPHFGADRRMSTISAGDLVRYRDHRMNDQKAKAATVNREMAVMRRAFRLAVRREELIRMPHVEMVNEDNVRKGFLEREQLEAILKHLPTYLHPALEFMYATGWRKSEVLGLTASQVDTKAGTVRLERGTTKSGKARTIVLMPDLLDIIEKQLTSIEALKKRDVICPYVFHAPDGSQITSLRKRWETARENAGYPTALLHDFRRSAARNLGRAGISRSTAMEITGHATESIFNRYDIKDEAVMREAAEKMQAWAEAQRGVKKPPTQRKGEVRRLAAR